MIARMQQTATGSLKESPPLASLIREPARSSAPHPPLTPVSLKRLPKTNPHHAVTAGRIAGLKIHRPLKACGFDPHSGHQLSASTDSIRMKGLLDSFADSGGGQVSSG